MEQIRKDMKAEFAKCNDLSDCFYTQEDILKILDEVREERMQEIMKEKEA